MQQPVGKAERICKKKYAAFDLGAKVEASGKETLVVKYENERVDFYDSFHSLLASVLTEHVIQTKEEEWLLDIIETMFYFHIEEEQQQILTIARSILEGDRKDLPSLRNFFDRYAHIYDAFAKNIDPDTTFYYERF